MKRRILLIVHLPPPVHGASIVNQYVVDNFLSNDEYKVKVLPLRFVSTIEDIGQFSLYKVWKMIVFIFRLLGALISFRPKLIYFTLSPKGGAFYRDALFTFLIRLFAARIIFHLHSRGIQQTMQSGSISRRICRTIFAGQDAICISQRLSDEFRGLPLRKLYILPNGIPYRGNSEQLPEHGIPRILVISNLFKSKGILIFIEALKKLQDRSVNFEAMVIGADGDIKAEELLELLETQGLSNKVTVKGPIYGEKKYEYLAASSIFVMPSFNEVFPLSILEAMQQSLPVIASDTGGIPDMVIDASTGFLCEPGNPEMLAEKIGFLIDNPSVAVSFGKQGKKIFDTAFTMEIFESRLKEIISSSLVRDTD